MARLRAILGAVWTAAQRDRKSLASFSGNNIFHAGFALLFLQDPGAFVFPAVLIGVVLLLPLSSDPLRKVPPDRMALWPLTTGEKRTLRIVTPWLNPLLPLIVAVLVWRKVTAGLGLLLGGVFSAGFLGPPRWSGRIRRLPNFPTVLNHLIRKNLRELFSTLDFYCGLLLAVPALVFRLMGRLPEEAMGPLTLVILLAISTCAQTLLGLDGPGGLTRYRLLPIRGWQILAAKDGAFLLVAVAMTAALAPLGGLAGAMIALAAGRRASVMVDHPQARWRFQMGASFGDAIFQLAAMTVAGAGAIYWNPALLALCAALYLGATWYYGRRLEQWVFAID
jgi:hypothetical protein